MKKTFIIIGSFIVSLNIQAQDDLTVNRGLLSVRNGTQFSTYFDFENQSSGNVINDGEFHFYGDYSNEGLFSYSTNTKTGYVVFEGKNKPIQSISGSSPSFFYDVLFNKFGNERSFELTNEIENKGTVNLHDGVVYVNKDLGGVFIFLKGANHINTSDSSHVNGEVLKEGNEAFKYPIGDSGYYRFASISAPIDQTSTYTGEYLFQNTNALFPHQSRTGVINKIDEDEYWVINKLDNSKGSVILTLSWDEDTTPSDLVDNTAKNLHIVRWDTNQKLWVDQGGIVDFANKTVTTPVEIDGYGVFTLATIKDNLINPGDVVIYDGVSPNGDGFNDYFIIDNIQYFPNNTVRIFNRWGKEVFKTTNYDSNGNVFNGYSDAKGTINKDAKLPTGTYYYILEYEYIHEGQSQMINKAGFLHLENND